MDIVLKAKQKREALRAELARIENFLALAYELEQGLTQDVEGKKDDTDLPQPVARVRARPKRGKRGVGADTVSAAVEIISERGPLGTRELLPFVLARGIEVGGRDAVATLSARLSNKDDLVMHHGKWKLNEAEKNEFDAETRSLALNALMP